MIPRIKKPSKTIYLDYAATTPVDPRVFAAMKPYFTEKYGNPSSIYGLGIEAKQAVSAARKSVATILGATPQEVIFTAGGTESVNMALFGVVRNFLGTSLRGGQFLDNSGKGRRSNLNNQDEIASSRLNASTNAPRNDHVRPHIIISAIEHHAVFESVEQLKREGCDVTIVWVDEFGFVNLSELQKAIRPETILVSLMYANNEVGTIEPIAEIGKWMKSINELRIKNNELRILFHTDACQAAGSLSLNVNKLGVDLLSVNGSKIYGPKQTGFLYVRKGVQLHPLIFGGGQEGNLRSGTENVPGIVGLATALELVQKNRLAENNRLLILRDFFIDKVFESIPNISLNGPSVKIDALRIKKTKNADGALTRLPNNINITISGVEGEMLVLYLDANRIAASTGSACTSESDDPSHVLLALGKSSSDAKSSIRFTLGKHTTKKDIVYTVKILTKLVTELRKVKH